LSRSRKKGGKTNGRFVDLEFFRLAAGGQRARRAGAGPPAMGDVSRGGDVTRGRHGRTWGSGGDRGSPDPGGSCAFSAPGAWETCPGGLPCHGGAVGTRRTPPGASWRRRSVVRMVVTSWCEGVTGGARCRSHSSRRERTVRACSMDTGECLGGVGALTCGGRVRHGVGVRKCDLTCRARVQHLGEGPDNSRVFPGCGRVPSRRGSARDAVLVSWRTVGIVRTRAGGAPHGAMRAPPPVGVLWDDVPCRGRVLVRVGRDPARSK